MEKEYYILYLNNNKSSNPCVIDNVIYKGEQYDLPEVMEEAKLISVYEPLEILAVKTLFSFKDVISGEVISSCEKDNEDGLTYYKCVKASRSDIIRITHKYETMSKYDIMRYKEGLLKIKDLSNMLYKERQEKLFKEIHEEKYARDFLVNFQEWSA
jgi:hypothetical protein